MTHRPTAPTRPSMLTYTLVIKGSAVALTTVLWKNSIFLKLLACISPKWGIYRPSTSFENSTEKAFRQEGILKMNRFGIAIACAGTLAFSAFAFTSNAEGRVWRMSSLKERNAYAASVVSALRASYRAPDMRACIDAFYAPPTSKNHQDQKISEIAVACHLMLQ